MCKEMDRLHMFAPFNLELLCALWLLKQKIREKNLLFEAEIYVQGYAHNAGFCNIYPTSYLILLGVSSTDEGIIIWAYKTRVISETYYVHVWSEKKGRNTLF
jgi:hypothetical protein